jgi:hypothetical protein
VALKIQRRRKCRNPLFAKRWFSDDIIILSVHGERASRQHSALRQDLLRRVEEGRLAGTYRQPTVSLRRVGPGTLTPSRSQNRT